MATTFIPRNKGIDGEMCNLAAAELLRSIISDDAQISGVGCSDYDYVNAKTARIYGSKIKAFIEKNPNDIHNGYLTRIADFFIESRGFWQG